MCLYTVHDTHVIVDVTGWFPAGSPLTVTEPDRVLDTRGTPRLTPDAGLGSGWGAKVVPLQVLAVPVPDRAGLAPGTAEVALTVTATESDASGFVTVWPCGQPIPVASTLELAPGASIANAVLTPLGVDGTVCVASSARTHLLLDVNAAYPTTASFTGITPMRIRDTRSDGPPA